MVLGEHVRHRVESSNNTQCHANHNLCVRNLGLAEVRNVLSDIVSHLRSGGWGAIVVLNHTVMQLWRHSNNHVVEIWVEVTTFWHIETEWWRVVVACQQVVRIVDQTGLMGSSFGQFWRPNTLVGILGLMNSHIWWPHSVLDLALSKVPLLEVVRAILLVTRMDLGEVNHLVAELNLSETFINEQIVLLMHGAVAALACS